jgi:heat shock protein HtpX
LTKQYVSSYEYIDHSKRNSIFVIFTYVVLFAVVFALLGGILSYFTGYYGNNNYNYSVGISEFLIPLLFGGVAGVIISLIICAVTYNRSVTILAKAADAHEVSRQEEPYLFETVDAIAGGVQLSTPQIYVIETPELNAFASGSSSGKSMIAVTRGLLEKMDREELEGVLAHEISHLKNDDIKFVSLAVALSATLLLITSSVGRGFFWGGGGRRRGSDNGGGNGIAAIVMIVVAVVVIAITPLLARALQGAVSRQREYLADASGAVILGYPLGLASALEKINAYNASYLESNKSAFKNKSVYALCISDPIARKAAGLFATHPPIEERIRRLRGGK